MLPMRLNLSNLLLQLLIFIIPSSSGLSIVFPPVLHLRNNSDRDVLFCENRSPISAPIYWVFWPNDTVPVYIRSNSSSHWLYEDRLGIRNVKQVGLYQCVVSVDGNAVVSFPGIAKHEKVTSVISEIGSSALLACSPSDLTVQWTLNGDSINSSHKIFSTGQISKIFINKVTKNDLGKYECKISGKTKPVLLKKIILRNKTQNKLIRYSESTNLTLSPSQSSFNLDCIFHLAPFMYNGSGNLGTFRWRRNGHLMKSKNLSIIHVTEPGLYECYVHHRKKKQKNGLSKIVSYNVTWQQSSSDLALELSARNRVICSVGTCPSVTWLFFNGENKRVFTHEECIKSETLLAFPSFYGTGNYQCFAKTASGWKQASKFIEDLLPTSNSLKISPAMTSSDLLKTLSPSTDFVTSSLPEKTDITDSAAMSSTSEKIKVLVSTKKPIIASSSIRKVSIPFSSKNPDTFISSGTSSALTEKQNILTSSVTSSTPTEQQNILTSSVTSSMPTEKQNIFTSSLTSSTSKKIYMFIPTKKTDTFTPSVTSSISTTDPAQPLTEKLFAYFKVESISPKFIAIRLLLPKSWRGRENFIGVSVFYRDVSSRDDTKEDKIESDFNDLYRIQKLKPNTTYEVWIQPLFSSGDRIIEGVASRRITTRDFIEEEPDRGVINDGTFLAIVLGCVFGVLGLFGIVLLVIVVMRCRQRSLDEETTERRQHYEKAQKAEKDVYEFPEAMTPCLESPKRTVSPSPPPKKPVSDYEEDDDDDEPLPPGYAPVMTTATDKEPESVLLSQAMAAVHPGADDGIPNYAQLNEASRMKYRRKSSARRVPPENLESGIEVLDYAELEMPQGGPLPAKSPEDEVDYAEIDFTRTK